jgi:hypothetical protein
MKKIISKMLCLPFLISFSTHAITLQKPVQCGKFIEIREELKTQHEEIPIWQGKTNVGTIVIFFINRATNSWTLVETDGNLGCLISEGESVQILNQIKFD